MNDIVKKAALNWKHHTRVRKLNNWFFGPVFFVNSVLIVLSVTFSELGDNYQQDSFWAATQKTLITVLQAIGLSFSG
jgi:hypothetical protein